jgi:hypothetical protein
VKGIDMPNEEYYRKIAEEAMREADRTSMDRSDMARILECLYESGHPREHLQPDFIWCLTSDGRSLGSIEHKVVDLLKSVGLINGELRTVPFPQGDLEREHYVLSDAGREFIDRFGAYGEGNHPWIDIEELREPIAKLERQRQANTD